MASIMTHLLLKLSAFFPTFEIELALPEVPGGTTIVDAKEEEVAQQSHGRHHPDICLAVVGENRQETNGVGMEKLG